MPITVDQSKFLKVAEQLDTMRGVTFTSSNIRTYTRTFLVVTNDRNIGASYVCGAEGIPRPFSIYDNGIDEYDEFAVLVNYDCSKFAVDDFYHWTIVCNYSTEVPDEGVPTVGGGNEAEIGREPEGWHNAPWHRPAVVRWDYEETTHVPPCDLDGRPFLNSARQPFTPAPSFPIARMVLIVEQNELYFDREIASEYAFAVNADVFLGAAPGCAQCLPIRCERRNLGPIPYFKNTYRIRFGLPERGAPNDPAALDLFPTDDTTETPVLALQSFQPEILDQGFGRLQLTGPNVGRPTNITRNGMGITQPALLDGQGQEIVPNGDGHLIAVFLRFRQFHSKNFAPILTGGVF